MHAYVPACIEMLTDAQGLVVHRIGVLARRGFI